MRQGQVYFNRKQEIGTSKKHVNLHFAQEKQVNILEKNPNTSFNLVL